MPHAQTSRQTLRQSVVRRKMHFLLGWPSTLKLPSLPPLQPTPTEGPPTNPDATNDNITRITEPIRHFAHNHARTRIAIVTDTVVYLFHFQQVSHGTSGGRIRVVCHFEAHSPARSALTHGSTHRANACASASGVVHPSHWSLRVRTVVRCSVRTIVRWRWRQPATCSTAFSCATSHSQPPPPHTPPPQPRRCAHSPAQSGTMR